MASFDDHGGGESLCSLGPVGVVTVGSGAALFTTKLFIHKTQFATSSLNIKKLIEQINKVQKRSS
jgi:hypothetical protein